MSLLKKYTGISVSDVELKNIGNCRFELHTRAAVKGMQTGSMIGLTFLPAVTAVKLVLPNAPLQRQTITHYTTAGLILGGLAAPALYYATKSRHYNQVEACAHAYRLRLSNSTLWMDRGSMLGTLCGAGVAYFLGQTLSSGAVLGFAGGSLAACVAVATGVVS